LENERLAPKSEPASSSLEQNIENKIKAGKQVLEE